MSSTQSVSAPARAWRRFGVLLTIVVVLIALNVYVRQEPDDIDADEPTVAPSAPTFVGSSHDLKRTLIVPTLESTLPANQSVVWCGTLALAWQTMARDIVKEPIQLRDAAELADALNRCPPGEMRDKDRYAAAGWYEDGILDKIRREFAERFPKSKLPSLPEESHGGLAFAYLEVAQIFTYSFRGNLPLVFTAGDGRSSAVQAFGFDEGYLGQGEDTFRKQVGVLYRDRDGFALDLCTTLRPYQIVLARIPRQKTLSECLAYLDGKTAGNPSKNLRGRSVLLVPEMSWHVDHTFDELAGKQIANANLHRRIRRAWQTIDFKLDRHGALLTSAAGVDWDNGDEVDSDPTRFVFDRPYLLVMRQRDAPNPFFVMWVDNAELLRPSSAEKKP